MCPEHPVYSPTSNSPATNLCRRRVVIASVASITSSKVKPSTSPCQGRRTRSPPICRTKTCCSTRWTEVMQVCIASKTHREQARRCPPISTLSSWVTSSCRIGAQFNVSGSRALMIAHTSAASQDYRSVHLITLECLVGEKAAGIMVAACSTIRSFDRLSKVRIDCRIGQKLLSFIKTLLKF